MRVGQVVFVPGWVINEGLHVFEGVVAAQRGRWATVDVRFRWRVVGGAAAQENWSQVLTVSTSHLGFSLMYLLGFVCEAQNALAEPPDPIPLTEVEMN